MKPHPGCGPRKSLARQDSGAHLTHGEARLNLCNDLWKHIRPSGDEVGLTLHGTE